MLECRLTVVLSQFLAMNSNDTITWISPNHGILRRLLPEVHIQTFELVLAATVFIILHSLGLKWKYGVSSWPLVGMLPSLIGAYRRNLYEWVTDVVRQNGGTFNFRGPWFTDLHLIMTADPANMEHLVKTNFPNFPKGPAFRNILGDLLGDGIFNADGEVWRRQRKTAGLEFHTQAFRELTITSLVELVHSQLLPVLDQAMERMNNIDLQDLLLRLTFDHVCIMALGIDVGWLRPELPELPFARAFEYATEVSTLRFIMPTSVWTAMRYLNVGQERELKKSIKIVHDFGGEVIQARKKELGMLAESSGTNSVTVTSTKSDLLSAFMRLKDEKGEAYSDKFLKDVCINFILAGRDTSSVAMAWFFWLVACHPAVEEKILSELRKIVALRKTSSTFSHEKLYGDNNLIFTPEEVKQMEYLHSALSESLRLYPSVPIEVKEPIEDDRLPDGTELKKNKKVMFSLYTMGRMESIWGEDCREYKPERWMREGKFVGESAYKFAAFNGGPRLCLGKDFAYYQMKFVAASIFYRYCVRLVDGHPVLPKFGMTLYMKHGLMVNLVKRSDM